GRRRGGRSGRRGPRGGEFLHGDPRERGEAGASGAPARATERPSGNGGNGLRRRARQRSHCGPAVGARRGGRSGAGARAPGSRVESDPGTSGVGDPRARARGQSTLGDLLAALISAVPQVRFRLSSIEATEVDDTIARLLIEAPAHLAAHLHAPLQSGANRILKRMGRHWYTAESYRAPLGWLAERLPVFGLGADIIAGFPGESDAEHRQTI